MSGRSGASAPRVRPPSAHARGAHVITTKEAPVSEFYEGRQFVGMDLHRRRSVLVRMTESGEHLETVRILNDRDGLAGVMSRAGESPEVVLEATYGWYWAADALAELGASVHLAHPLGVKAFSYRRGEQRRGGRRIWRTCCGWVGCRTRGSRRRKRGNCGSWCGTGPNWSRCDPNARPTSTPCRAK